MKNNFAVLVASIVGLAALTGCYSTPSGSMKVGVPFSDDRIVSRYEWSADKIFNAAKEVLQFNGTLYGENTINKTLEAKIDTRTVWVKVEQLDGKVAQVTTQTRTKRGSGDKDLASEIDKQIALRLK